MNGEQLYNLTTEFLGGNAMDEEVFYILLNAKKNIREMMRDWMRLRTFDSSITFTTSDTYTGTKSLPSRFLRPYMFYDQYGQQKSGVFLIDSSGNKTELKPIKFAERFDYKDADGYYYLDVKNGTIGRTGSKAGTLHLYFLQGSSDIDENGTWALGGNFAAILAYDVAVEQKGGIDWDRVNASQVPYNQGMINTLWSAMCMEDARLQQAELGV